MNSYKINFLELSGWSDKKVINIFGVMNSRSKKLTHVELMNGAIFNVNSEFNLLKEIRNISDSYKNSVKIDPEFMIQLLKTFFDIKYRISNKENEKISINYKKDNLIGWSMDNQKVNEFIKLIPEFKKILKSSLSELETRFNFYSINELPKKCLFISCNINNYFK